MPRAATELAKEWRTDGPCGGWRPCSRWRTGNTHCWSRARRVIQPSDGIVGIGSGGGHAIAAAQFCSAHSTLDAATIVRTSLTIAAGIDIYTNTNIVVEELEC